jgi:hypothetical protein
MKQIGFKSKCKIGMVDVTEDTLTGRGGLALFVRYLSQVNIYGLLFNRFSDLGRSAPQSPG